VPNTSTTNFARGPKNLSKKVSPQVKLCKNWASLKER
jgi:hypothetical protein